MFYWKIAIDIFSTSSLVKISMTLSLSHNIMIIYTVRYTVGMVYRYNKIS